jgi:heterodisulfide reductase subunit C
MDRYAIVLLAVIMLSGMLWQGVKITSYTEFKYMEEDYSGLEDPDEIEALESYWVRHFGLVSPHVKGPFDVETLSTGRELHEGYCADCHSSSKWTFTGYATAKMISPIALALERANIGTVLRYIHFLACFIGLAYLPFSKMFHIISSPLILLTNAVMDKEKSHPANLATKRMLELDACTHCGTCSVGCSVGPVFEAIPNPNILPSEKIAALKVLAAGKTMKGSQRAALQEGLCVCTNCHRCTDICPVGINLQDLWTVVREDMLKAGEPEFSLLSPLSIYRALVGDGAQDDDYYKPIRSAYKTVTAAFHQEITNNTLSLESRSEDLQRQLQISIQGKTFSACYNCQTCTTACPLIHNFDHPQQELGLAPHQMMHAMSLGLKDLILESRMLWACLGCYRCQEQCPQGVRVTDVFYQLKNIAMENLREKGSKT